MRVLCRGHRLSRLVELTLGHSELLRTLVFLGLGGGQGCLLPLEQSRQLLPFLICVAEPYEPRLVRQPGTSAGRLRLAHLGVVTALPAVGDARVGAADAPGQVAHRRGHPDCG